MDTYLKLLTTLRAQGQAKPDRTGVGVTSIFGYSMRFDLNAGFPLLTTKKLFTHSIVTELLWFLRGDTNIQWLHKHNCHIWDAWADDQGNLGPVYGKQWRSWQTQDGRVVDQITEVLQQIRQDPHSRRLVVSAWNPGDLPHMALAPCHCLFQFYVSQGRLSCQLYQRSADAFLGLPFNIASYALLTHMMAQQAGLGVGEFVWTGGDVHLYANHYDQVALQLSRTPRPLPRLELKQASSLFDYTKEDICFKGYDPHPAIKAPIAV